MPGIIPPFCLKFGMEEMVLGKEKNLPGRARLKSSGRRLEGILK